MPVTILRFGIIYGPHHADCSAVESIFTAVKNDEPISVGSLKTGRRYIHVSDIVRGIIAAVGLPGFEIINLSGDRIITLEEIITESENILSKKARVVERDPRAWSVINPSNTYASEMLDWEPLVGLRDGLGSILPFI